MARQQKTGIVKGLARILLRLALLFFGGSFALVLLFSRVDPPITLTMLFDSNRAKRSWVNLDAISPEMAIAVIAPEDSKFCEHAGFDQQEIEKALEERSSGKRQRGASTISQQTAKNVFLWQGGGFVRKVFEAWFTLLIEWFWSKQRIMEVYLNVAETGIGTYGVEEGAKRYFDKSASRLSRSEASRIAAAIPAPKTRSVRNPSGWTRRYGNIIASRITTVRRDGLDSCIR